MLSDEKKELIEEAKNNVSKILAVNKECKRLSGSHYTACYWGETTAFVVSNICSDRAPIVDHIAFCLS